MASEKTIERKLREGVEAIGGMCIKLLSILVNGLPDRLVLLPHGQIAFVELKSTGKKQSPVQKRIMASIKALGFECYVIDNEEDLNKVLKKWMHDVYTKNLLK